MKSGKGQFVQNPNDLEFQTLTFIETNRKMGYISILNLQVITQLPLKKAFQN